MPSLHSEPGTFPANHWRPLLGNAVMVALVVGTALNLVNQGQQLFHGADVAWSHVLLNYCIPFCVSAYSIARATRLRPTHTANTGDAS